MRESRLGDIIDDYCVKCRRLTNHSVVSILNEEPAKVRCRTCYNDHDYRREQAPPPKVDSRKAALFNEVLATMPDAPPRASAAPEPVAVHDEPEPIQTPVTEAPPKAASKARVKKAPTK
ncbi:MAG: hypothetical protein M3Z23_02760 [Acidobacteriota bacterium]|nr:hypothetical protein [Acidobacteriota bacterium]